MLEFIWRRFSSPAKIKSNRSLLWRTCSQSPRNCGITGRGRQAIFIPSSNAGDTMCSFLYDEIFLTETDFARPKSQTTASGLRPWNNVLHSHLATLNALSPRCLRRLQGSSYAWSFASGDEFRDLSEDDGQLEKELDVLWRMDQQGTLPSVRTYRSLLKACFKRNAIIQANQVHGHITKHGLESNKYLGEYLVSTLVKCGGLESALEVFYRLPHRTVFSWTAVISGYTMCGRHQEALNAYYRMQEEGVQPNTYTFVTVLKACGSSTNLHKGRKIHADAVKSRCQSDLFVAPSLIDMYSKCGSMEDARKVFDGLSQRNIVLWNAMLVAYVKHGEAEKTLQLYEQMRNEGVIPDVRTYVHVLQACGMLGEKEDGMTAMKAKSLKIGKAVHADLHSKGHESDVFVGSTLISMYGKCGSIIDAWSVFDDLSYQDVVSWNVILLGCAQQGQAFKALQLYEQMQDEGVSPDVWTFVSVIQACGTVADFAPGMVLEASRLLHKGKVIHADVWKKGHTKDLFIASTLVDMYGKCGSISDACIVFNQIPDRDVVTWTALLAAHVQQGQGEESLELYEQMQVEGLSPNDRTFVSVLQACGMIAEKEDAVSGQALKVTSLVKGKTIHAHALSKGYVSNVFLGSTLISMYGKCGNIRDANNVFNSFSECSVVAWTAMLAIYAEQGLAEKALQLYTQMQEEGLSPDVWTLVSMVQACCVFADQEEDIVVDGQATKFQSLGKGKAAHAEAQRKGFGSDGIVSSALICMYGRCGSRSDAQNLFNGLSNTGMVAWNAMIGAYAQQGEGDLALQLYSQMQEQGMTPDEITFLSLLQACSHMGSLAVCRQIHHSCGSCMSPLLTKSLIHAYGRCGSMVEAQMIFDTLPQPDVVAWTTLMAGYARQGNYVASLHCYEEMKLTGTKPDGITFLSLLAACSHAGLVDKGVEYFETMTIDYGIIPRIEHFVSMVDLLGRAGSFTVIEHLLSLMPVQPDLALWLCLLGACRKHGELQLGKQVFECAIDIQPKSAAAYVLMSNMYADAGLSDRTREVKQLQQKESAWKMPGQSWIENDEIEHVFVVGSRSHEEQEQLDELSGQLSVALREGQQCAKNGFIVR